MGKPAARIGDMHVCPMVTPGVPPIPHVGGPVTGPGCPTVLIGGMPAAVMGDMCVCTGPPDVIILGSVGVLIGGKPAARMGDMCAHGGTIVLGCPTVLIGEVMPSPVTPGVVTPEALKVIVPPLKIKDIKMPPAAEVKAAQIRIMKDAANLGTPLVHSPNNCDDCSRRSN